MVLWETHADQSENENNLGILLVMLREEFRALKSSDPYVVKPLSIPNFKLMWEAGSNGHGKRLMAGVDGGTTTLEDAEA
jgi:hypothetical protein